MKAAGAEYRAWALGKIPDYRPCRMELWMVAKDESLKPLQVTNNYIMPKPKR